MLNGIEALLALERAGTIGQAASSLRLTQSAVTKRIQALENELGFSVIEPEGRRVRITTAGAHFLSRARPLYVELLDLTSSARESRSQEYPHWALALSDSIAASWGPKLLQNTLRGLRRDGLEIQIAPHSHRSVLVLEHVRMGRYQIGLCARPEVSSSDLIIQDLTNEPMVLLRSESEVKTKSSRAKSSRSDVALTSRPLVTIEESSATWSAIEPKLREFHSHLLKRPRITVESFSAVLELSRAGFGDGLLPLGLVPKLQAERLAGVDRKISLVARKSTTQSESFERFAMALQSRLDQSWK